MSLAVASAMLLLFQEVRQVEAPKMLPFTNLKQITMILHGFSK
jgi:hypothetical protein